MRYFFQVIDHAGVQKIFINSAEDAQLEEKIKELYTAATVGISRRGLYFLESILPPQ